MTYRIARNGQVFGPYTTAQIHEYLQTGNVLLTDLAQLEGTEEWTPVEQLFPAAPTQPPVDAYATARLYPDPPDLPWWVVIILWVFTCSIFTVLWGVYQASWLYRIDRRSTAIWWYVAWAAAFFIKLPNAWHQIRYNIFGDIAAPHGVPHVGLIAFVLAIASRYVFRSELERHFNVDEPIGLRLGGFMTLFGSVYFQYHFNRINEVKRAMRISVPS